MSSSQSPSSLQSSSQSQSLVLPSGWIMKESNKSRKGKKYYFNTKTGEKTWDFPKNKVVVVNEEEKEKDETVHIIHILRKHKDSRRPSSWRNATITMTKKEAYSQLEDIRNDLINKEIAISRSNNTGNNNNNKEKDETEKEKEKEKKPITWDVIDQQIANYSKKEDDNTLDAINDTITDTINDTNGKFIEYFKHIASLESDCSSGPERKGDLGRFGKNKMQKSFEECAFALDVNEMSNIIETKSGLHILLRI